MAIELEKRELRSYDVRKKKYKQTILIAAVISTVVLIVVTFFIVRNIINKNFNNFEVVQSTERNDSSAAKYLPYEGGLLRYSRDGVAALNSNGKQLWNGTYQMREPIVDICNKYVAISDRGYKTIQIYDGSGKNYTINVLLPIIKVKVASQGVVAVLMDGGSTNELKLLTQEGETIVEFRTIAEKNGYPLDISLSKDGKRLVTSYATLNTGSLLNNVTFYNFGNVGQNAQDRMVGAFGLGPTLVPDVEFITNDIAAAFGDNKFSLYSIEQTAKLIYEENFTKEIKTVLHNGKYIGFIFNNSEGSDKYQLVLYDLQGKIILNKGINYEYDTAILSGDEILLHSNLDWRIIKTNGQEKFKYTFTNNISYIMPLNNTDKYIVIDNQKIDEVKLIESK
ncbi:hypothetical protein acsn021_43920 [Anaerocolumna cellulosilytica]|uniref:Uncharacterized protein n=1 Tax=Anaerocolumna cellulosilytica TaxID=433286 RepID=A0A6S6R068_9FIRM|nr:DUF5711 family protein [Anaerocolumna cellulosilytica]MBB5195813.1 hypothetical protein [Anaerocolumna cellulosilytica]BCJ96823.1 hypothetical protein acsn021_43920 [Anaerocolumna cellulosilytica]